MKLKFSKKLTWLLSIVSLAFISIITAASIPAQAGGKKLYFGGPLGNFNATRHGSDHNTTYQKKTKSHSAARARAKARAKAKRKAQARAIAARKRKAAKIRAARARARDSGPTESNTTAVPSTAALLTKNDADIDEAKNAENTTDDNVTVATTDTESTAPEDEPNASSDDANVSGEGNCRRFVPEVGMTISVEC